MKLVYFNYLYDSQQDSVGASVHVKEFVNAVSANGHEIKPFNLNPAYASPNGELRAEGKLRRALKRRFRPYLAQLNQLARNVPLFVREWRILSEEQPDILMIRYNMLNFSAAIAAKLKGIPVLLEVNSPHAFERKNLVKDIWNIPLVPFLVERLLMNIADKIVTVSNALKSYYLEKNISADKISVVPNGVDIRRFSPDIPAEEIKEKHHLGDKVVLGFVGSFHYWHGIDNLLSLIEFTRTKYENVAYLLVGDGPLKQKVEEFVQSRGLKRDVILTGYVPHTDVPNYVAAMDIVLAPYPQMDFFYFSPLKIFEYLSAGKALVASRIGQISDMIQHNEIGLLYEPGDLTDLFKKTSKLIEDEALRERLGRSARTTILQGYTWENNAEQVIDVINHTLKRIRLRIGLDVER